MIVSFKDKTTADLYHGHQTKRTRKIPLALKRAALRKLDMLNNAHQLNDLKMPPGNRLELLRGDLAGYYSIRVNDQWRIIFKWSEQGAVDVSFCDYH